MIQNKLKTKTLWAVFDKRRCQDLFLKLATSFIEFRS